MSEFSQITSPTPAAGWIAPTLLGI